MSLHDDARFQEIYQDALRALEYLPRLEFYPTERARIAERFTAEFLARHPAPTVHDDHAKLAPELMRLLDDLDADSENDNYSKGDAADEIRQALKNACGCERGAPIHSRRCPDRAQLQVQAPVESVSDAEREALAETILSIRFTDDDGNDIGPMPRSHAWVAIHAAISAGYRKAPVVSVEDVARVLSPYCGTGLTASNAATAVMALFNPKEES